jgi:hypothetical protein
MPNRQGLVVFQEFINAVNSLSNSKPSSFRALAALWDSSTPEGARGTSTHPVKRFSMFHWLSPCLMRTKV